MIYHGMTQEVKIGTQGIEPLPVDKFDRTLNIPFALAMMFLNDHNVAIRRSGWRPNIRIVKRYSDNVKREVFVKEEFKSDNITLLSNDWGYSFNVLDMLSDDWEVLYIMELQMKFPMIMKLVELKDSAYHQFARASWPVKKRLIYRDGSYWLNDKPALTEVNKHPCIDEKRLYKMSVEDIMAEDWMIWSVVKQS